MVHGVRIQSGHVAFGPTKRTKIIASRHASTPQRSLSLAADLQRLLLLCYMFPVSGGHLGSAKRIKVAATSHLFWAQNIQKCTTRFVARKCGN